MKKILRFIITKKNLRWVLLFALIVIVIIFFTVNRNNDVIVIKKHRLYQYFDGIKFEFKGRIQINKKSEEITKISFEGNTTELDSFPLYYEDLPQLIFPKNMAVVYPLIGKQYKINFFTTAYLDADEVCVKDKRLVKRLFDTIIYDGRDLYITTEDSTVTIGNDVYNVSALSYIEVNTFSQTVKMFDYKNEKYISVDNVVDEVIISNGSYKVNASLDLMYYDNKSKLFIKDVSKLTNLPKKG